MTRKFLAQFVLKNENLYIYYLHYSKVHFKKLFQRMMKRWCWIDAPDHCTIWWVRFLTWSLTFKKMISFNSSLTIKSEFILPHPLINAHFSDVIGQITSARCLHVEKWVICYLKVESEVSRSPQSMVWNALLPIKCQFVSNCHVRSKT